MSLFEDGEFFILRANGDSMTGVGINNGDLMVIRKLNAPEKSQIVVAFVH